MKGVAILTLLLLAACQDPRMSDPTFARANQECDYEAAKASANLPTMADRVSERVDLRRRCMALRGY